MTTRAVIFGGDGMVGGAVVAEARSRGWAALALNRAQADIRNRELVDWWLSRFRPDVVLNCAAFTAVDECEERRDEAMAVNGEAVGVVGAAASRAGARLVHVSSDYVFDGSAERAYVETDPPSPISVYGESKLAGERAALEHDALVVRSSWLFGPHGPSFVTAMIGLMDRGEVPLRVVADQVGCPTYTPFLARALCDLAGTEETGIVHYCNREPVSWFEFAREIAALWDRTVEVTPLSTEEFPRPAPRPAWSVLDPSRFESLVGRRVEAWGWGLADLLSTIQRRRATARGAPETG